MRGIYRAFVAVLLTLSHSSEAHSTKRNALGYISRLDDPVLHSPSHRVHAYSSFELTFLLHDGNEKIRLTLQPNHDVLSDEATVQYLNADGTVRYEEPIRRSDHRVYKGDAFVKHPGHGEWLKAGWARISVYRDGAKPMFEGAFRIDGDNHHVQSSINYRRTQHDEDPSIDSVDDDLMVVWRDSDVLPDHGSHGELKRSIDHSTCGSDNLDFNNELDHPVLSGIDLRDMSPVEPRRIFGRQDDTPTGGNGAGVNLASTIGSTNGCPTTRKIALVGIATDCGYTAEFDSEEAARANIIQMVSSASEVYESTFNISLGIHDLVVSDAACPGTAQETAPWNVACSSSVDITSRLNLFSTWRGQRNDTNAYWTLLSTCSTKTAVGLAWLGQLCVTGTGGGSNQTTAGANVVVKTSTEWQVFAHESGHTFGAVHDCVSSTCSNGDVTLQKCCPLTASSCDASGQFMMNPATGSGITQFSACSVGNICSALLRNSVNSSCLTNNKDVVTIQGSQCGNGIVEQGEECDCGGADQCGDNSCCNATTCQFVTGAVCDPSNEECCTAQCQYKSANATCRASTGACDPGEVCTGLSAACPKDEVAVDGSSCGSNGAGLACASGQCTSRDLQCRAVVSSATTANMSAACDSQGCNLACISGQPGLTQCNDMVQFFLDGTPCQGGGKCSNGQCEGSNFANEVGSWINDNKTIFIPVVSVVGSLILLSIICCCWNRRKRPSRRKAAPVPMGPHPNAAWQDGSAWNAVNMARPPRAASRGPGNRLSRAAPPSYPPNNDPRGLQRVQTARYA